MATPKTNKKEGFNSKLEARIANQQQTENAATQSVSKAVLQFNEIKGSLHGKGDVQQWLLPPLDPKKRANSFEPAPGIVMG